MPAKLSDNIPRTRTEAAAKGNTFWRTNTFAPLAAVFLLALTANLAQHFLGPHVRETFAFDGNHYLLSCQKVSEFLIGALRGHPDISLLSAKDFTRLIVWDGPIIPSLPAFLFAACGHVPGGSDWRIVTLLYSVVQAISASLTALVALTLIGRRSYAVAAGLLFALYPSSLIVSGRYCSEVPSILFILAFVLSLAFAREKKWCLVAAGICAGLIAMSKPVLIPTVAAAILVASLRSSKKLVTFLCLIFLTAGTIAPWAVYTRLTCGKASITAERGPTYNAAVACDLDTDGWCSMPESAVVRIHSNDTSVKLISKDASPLPVLLSGWMSHPQECCALTLRKITRLFSQPWNDFRETVFGISVGAQQVIHFVLLMLGLFGASCHLLNRRRIESDNSRLLADLCLLFLAGHLGFAVFQAMGRYAITAIPLLAAFSASGLHCLFTLSAKASSARKELSRAALLSFILVSGIYLADPLTRLDESHETSHILAPGDSALKSIELSKSNVTPQPASALLLVDGTASLANARLAINGHVLAEKLKSLNHFSASQYLLFNTMREHSQYMRLSVDDFRQWRAAPVPVEWLNLKGRNEISLLALDRPVELFGDTSPSKRTMPSPSYFASDRMVSQLNSLEPRLVATTLTAAVSQSSSLKPAGQPSSQLSDSLRVKLAIARDNPSLCPAGKAPDSAAPSQMSLFVSPLSPVDKLLEDRSGSCFRINKYILKTASSTALSCRVPPLVQSSHLSIQISGKFRVLKGSGKVGLPVTLAGPSGQAMILGKSPNFLKGTAQWTPFVIEDLVPVRNFGGTLKEISLTLFPLPWQEAWYGCDRDVSDAQFAGITVKIEAVNLPELSDKTVVYY